MDYRFKFTGELDIAGVDALTKHLMYQGGDYGDHRFEQLFGFDATQAPTFSIEGEGFELINWLTKECPVRFTEGRPESECFYYRGGDWDLPTFLMMIRMRWSV